MKNKKRILKTILCFCLIYLISSPKLVYGEEAGVLNLTLRYKDKPISGVEFSLYQVADLSADKTGYSVRPPFKYGGDLADIKTARDLIDLSIYFEKQSQGQKELRKAQTNKDGRISFAGLKDGLYLLTQTGATGEGENYTKLTSFLIMVPQFENGLWNYKVEARPKTEPKTRDIPKNPPGKPPVNPPYGPPKRPNSRNPKTGYFSNLSSLSVIFILSGFMLILIERKKKR